jgi:hypothetical protein
VLGQANLKATTAAAAASQPVTAVVCASLLSYVSFLQGTIPAPACLGVEFVRHRQAMVQSMHHHQHQQQQQHHIPHDVDLIHADAQASSSISDSTNSSSAEAYMRHAASSTSAHPSTSSAPVFEGSEPAQDPEYHGRPSILQRLQDIHAEASERLEGQDPLWFGKAFAARAALNWESMKNTAGQVLESAKADLGIQTKSEEPK